MEAVAVDLDVATERHVGRRDEGAVLVHVFVLGALEELALHDARVLLGWLEDRDGVVGEVKRNHEAAVHVLGHARVEARSEPQDLLVVVHVLEEVSLGLVRHQLVHVAEGVHLVSKPVVGRDLDGLGLSGLGLLDASDFEVLSLLSLVESLSEFVDSLDSEDSSEGVNDSAGLNLVPCQVVVADEVLAWLVHSEALGQLLSLQHLGEGIAPIIGVVHLSDFASVVSQIVVDNVGHVFALGVKAEDLPVVVEELLLGDHSAAAECLLEELFHLCVFLLRHNGNGLIEVSFRGYLRFWLRLPYILHAVTVEQFKIVLTSKNSREN